MGQEGAFSWDFQAQQPPSVCAAAGIVALVHHGGTISTRPKTKSLSQIRQMQIYFLSCENQRFSRDCFCFFFFVFFLTVHPATGPLLPDSASPHQALGRTWGTSQLCDSSLTAAGAASVSIASQLGQARGAADAAVPALPPRGSLHTPRAPSESRGRGQAVGTAELFTR